MQEANGVRVTLVVENWIDILLPATELTSRRGLIYHFRRDTIPLQAEGGFSVLVEVFGDAGSACVLMDCGLSGNVALHNFAALGIDPTRIEQIVLSHGHLDHLGGMPAVLGAIGHPVPVITHPDAMHPRYVVMGGGMVASFYNQGLRLAELEDLGARFVLARTPIPLGPGAVTTGEIPRVVEFEQSPPAPEMAGVSPGIFEIKDEALQVDEVWDELAIVVNVRDRGLVVITGCGHAGIVNTVKRAQDVAETERLALVMGGFHLAFPGTAGEKIRKTVDALQELQPTYVAPMHCSGFECIAAVAHAMPERFVQYAVGSAFTIGAVSDS